jgi:molybdenum cofactor biosynthesis enzyme MoaA
MAFSYGPQNDETRRAVTIAAMTVLDTRGRPLTSLRASVRSGASAEEIRATIEAVWRRRADRGAEERREERDRAPLLPAAELRRDPHREMQTRGG